MNIVKQLKPILLVSSLVVSPFSLANQFFLGAPETAEGLGDVEAKWNASVEFGYVAVSGNNDTTSTNGRLNLGYEVEKWRHQGFLAVQANETDSEDTENYAAEVKSDYKINDRAYGFGLLGYDKIDNSGFDYQASAVVGVGYSFIKDDVHTLDGEIGFGTRKSRISAISEVLDENDNVVIDEIPASTESEGITRIAGAYKRVISETSNFEQLLSSEIGDDNTITTSLTSLTANIV